MDEYYGLDNDIKRSHTLRYSPRLPKKYPDLTALKWIQSTAPTSHPNEFDSVWMRTVRSNRVLDYSPWTLL